MTSRSHRYGTPSVMAEWPKGETARVEPERPHSSLISLIFGFCPEFVPSRFCRFDLALGGGGGWNTDGVEGAEGVGCVAHEAGEAVAWVRLRIPVWIVEASV
jgi:hypothetical protein